MMLRTVGVLLLVAMVWLGSVTGIVAVSIGKGIAVGILVGWLLVLFVHMAQARMGQE